jgi:hypothetical protein
MAIQQFNWPLMRCLVTLRRIAAALDRLAPAPTPALPRQRIRPDFSVATTEDFDRGYDARNSAAEEPQ